MNRCARVVWKLAIAIGPIYGLFRLYNLSAEISKQAAIALAFILIMALISVFESSISEWLAKNKTRINEKKIRAIIDGFTIAACVLILRLIYIFRLQFSDFERILFPLVMVIVIVVTIHEMISGNR